MKRVAPLLLVLGSCATAPEPTIAFSRDDARGVLTVSIAGRDACAWQYGEGFAIPHLYPIRSPGGRELTAQHPDPYPHHRSLWIADRVGIEGAPDVDFYHEWKNLHDRASPESGHHSAIRQHELGDLRIEGDRASFTARLTWMAKDVPVLADRREFTIRDLGGGEYTIEMRWELRAEFGDVGFASDAVHYAWPFVRMAPAFSVDGGGTMVDDEGRRGQAETHMAHARWVDCSNTVDGETAGLALLALDPGPPPQWLTRDYGTFGPRRAAELSGTRFTLPRGESLGGQVAVLVHRGDAMSGRVAERFAELTEVR